jgi:RNA polymerase sigma-70 factor (ECF subfamily)
MEPTTTLCTTPSGRTDEEFEALADAYRVVLRRLAQRLVRNPEDAEDLLQESLLDAYRAFGTFRTGSNFYSWMTRIITNNHLDRVRKKRVSTISLEGTTLEGDVETLELADESGSPEQVVLTRMFDPVLTEALETLLPSQRRTVLLCDLEGASYEEAAQAQGCPIGTVRSRLHRAHVALQRFLTGSGAGEERSAAEKVRTSRRNLLRMGTAVAAGVVLAPLAAAEPVGAEAAAAEPAEIRVRVWGGEADEERVTRIASGLRREARLRVMTGVDGRGLDHAALEETDVLIVAGSRSGVKFPVEVEEGIARRVREGRLGLVVTGNAGACGPLERLLGQTSFSPNLGGKADEVLTVQVSAPRHPAATGLSEFTLPAGVTTLSSFEGPKPDVVVFRGRGAREGAGSWQGMAWTLGHGRVFCFLPGEVPGEAYRREEVARVLRNAATWCGSASPHG